MGLWDSLKNALNIGGNEPIYTTSYELPTKLDKAKYLAKKGLSSIKDGKSFLFDKIGGFTDKVGDKVENALFGQLMPNKIEATEITQDKDGNTVIESGVGTPTREGGMITDFVTGFKDNFNNKFQPANLMGNDKKGFVQRIGEGLGTVARFAGSPLGRGLLMAGTVGALGGSGGQALAYGLGTTAGNQGIRTADKIYRDSLINYEQDRLINTPEFANMDNDQKQAALSKIANQYNNIPGYINQNMFNSIQQAQQLRDNMEWRKANLEAQQNQNKILNDLRQKELNLGYAKLEADKEGKLNKNLNNLGAVSNQLARFEETFKTMPGKIESNTLGRLRNATGFQTPNEANFNSQRTLLFNKIARDLGGEKGVLSDQDIKRIEVSLPSFTDSYEQKQAKMQAIYDLLEDRLSVEGVNLNNSTTKKDSLGIL